MVCSIERIRFFLSLETRDRNGWAEGKELIGDDCTWSIEPTNEEPSARGNSEAPPFFIFFLISRPFTSYFETVSKVSRIHRDKMEREFLK